MSVKIHKIPHFFRKKKKLQGFRHWLGFNEIYKNIHALIFEKKKERRIYIYIYIYRYRERERERERERG